MNEVLTSIRRAPYQSLASFLILFFTLFLSLLFFNILSFFYGFLWDLEAKPKVVVYFNTTTQEKDIFKIRDSIQQSGKSSKIKYISKQDAFKIYKQVEKEDPLLVAMVSPEILPPSLEIVAKKPTYSFEIAEYLKKQPGINEVDFQKDQVDKLLDVTNKLRTISMFMFLVLILISFMVLMTTTAFKIALKKDEIELLRLLGASNFYIRKPFLLEGVIFGLASGVVTFGLFSITFLYLQPFLGSWLAGVPSLPAFGLTNLNLQVWPPSINYVLLTFVLTIASGVLIGLIGNYLSTSKYIK